MQRYRIEDINPFRYLLSIIMVAVLLLVSLLIQVVPATPVQAAPATAFSDNFEGGFPGVNWTNPSSNWGLTTGQYVSETHSVTISATTGDLISCNIDLSSANVATLSFWFKSSGIAGETSDLILSFYDGSNYYEIEDLGAALDGGEWETDDGWVHYCTFINLDSSVPPYYKTNSFKIKFAAALERGETVWIDDVLVTTDPAASWPQFQYDKINTGTNSAVTGPTSRSENLTWDRECESGPWNGVDTAPVVAGGVVFTLSSAGYVNAFDAVSGIELWERNLLTSSNYTFELSSPAYGDGKLFVAENDGDLWALDAASGNTVWHQNITGETTHQLNTPLTYDGEYLYVGAWNGSATDLEYYCRKASDGTAQWTYTGESGNATGYYWAGASVIGDYVVFGDENGNLISVNRTASVSFGRDSDDEIDVFDLDASSDNPVRASVVWDSSANCVYTTDTGGYLYAVEYNSNNGTFGGHDWGPLEIDPAAGTQRSTCTPLVYEGKIYVGTGSAYESFQGILRCINQSDGSVNWTYPTSGYFGAVQSSPVAWDSGTEDYICFTTNNQYGQVYCLDDEGNLEWEFLPEEYGDSVEGYILQGVAVYDDRVYFGNDGGYLYCLMDDTCN